MPGGAFPLEVRDELATASPEWGTLSDDFVRWEIRPPSVGPASLGISNDVGCVHGERCSLVVRVGGGHLPAPRADVLSAFCRSAGERLAVSAENPADHVRRIVAWLEEQQLRGGLVGTYTVATLLVAVSSTEVLGWQSGPHGVAVSGGGSVLWRSTDLRSPVLRRAGVLPAKEFDTNEERWADELTSIFCVGTATGYETMRASLASGEVVVALDQGTLPFGPLGSSEGIGDLWRKEAGWRHGVEGRALAFGKVERAGLALPDGWQARLERFEAKIHA